MTDLSLLDTAEAVTKAKAEWDSAEQAVKYYQRVLAQAEAREALKRASFNQALAELRQVGGMTE